MLPTFPRAEQVKGTYFFDENWDRGTAWYRSHFATRAARAVVGRRLGYAPITFEASPYYLFVQALRSFEVPREREVQAVLDEALARHDIPDPAELGLLEEELVNSLLREGSPEARARARELLPSLLTHPAQTRTTRAGCGC